MHKLIEGVIDAAYAPDSRIVELENENRDLRVQLAHSRREVSSAKSDAERSVQSLRRQLSPLYQALHAVFGDMDAIGGGGDSPAADSRTAAVWASWKQKLGQGEGKIIDALLLHREMNTQQLAIACGFHRNSVPKLIYTLNKSGLINKSGGRFSLKTLN